MMEIPAAKNVDARESIMAAIREGLAASKPFDKVQGEHHGTVGVEACLAKLASPELSRRSLIEDFRINLESVGGNCMIVNDENEARERVRDLIVQKKFKRVAISNSELVIRLTDRIDNVEITENAASDILFDCDLGITAAQWAIAETGTLVLESEVERHRLTSLVPPIHLCLLKASNIRQTLGEILALINADLSRTITFITGASRTSDIELTLAIGVHGPAELHVIVIAD